MHIAYCIGSLHSIGGMERIITAKANYLASVYGYKVTIFTTGLKGRTPAFKLYDSINVYDLNVDYDSVIGYGTIKKFFVKRKMRKLHRNRLEEKLRLLKPDVVISTFTEEAAFLPLIKDGSKKIVEIHFSKQFIVSSLSNKNSVISKFYKFCFDWLNEHIYIPRFDKFICLTKEDLDFWGGETNKRICIYNMLPWKAKQCAKLENKIVIAVGRLVDQKGFDRLIDLWPNVYKLHPDWQLHIFGDGPDKDKLEKQINSLGLSKNIILKGNSCNIEKELLTASILVMTSRHEGMPMVMLEAKTCGLPVISYTYHCGPKEMVHHDRDGFVVHEGDAISFCSYLDRLMKDKDLRVRMGNAQIEDSIRFSPETIMSQWKKLFEELGKY